MRQTILAVLFVLGSLSPVFGMQFENNDKIFVDPNRILTEDYYAAGEDVNFQGRAMAQVFIAASSQATVSGTIGEDLNVATINRADISADVNNNLRVIASEIAVSGKVGGSTILCGSQIWIYRQATLEKDAVLLGGDVHLAGTVNDRLYIQGKKVVLDGIINAPLTVHSEQTIVTKNAQILAPVDYDSKNAALIEPNAIVRMPLQHKVPAAGTAALPGQGDGWKNLLLAGKLLYRMTFYVGLLAVGILLVLLMPQPTRRYALAMRHRVAANLGWGILTALGFVVLVLILLVTVVGIPVAIVLGVLGFAAVVAGNIGVGYGIGLQLLKPRADATGRSVAAFVIGFTLFSLLAFIPVVGTVLSVLVALVGAGAIWKFKGFQESLPVGEGLTPAAPKSESQAALPAAKLPEKPITSPSESAARKTTPGAVAKNWQPAVPAFKLKGKTIANKNSGPKIGTRTATRGSAKKTSPPIRRNPLPKKQKRKG